MTFLFSLLAGVCFGLGLLVSGMADPSKVLGFLDVLGHWDPSLACVMGGAIALGLPAFSLATRRRRSLLGHSMPGLPTRRIDRRLVAGSLVFGLGWGLAGICPGPAILLLGMASRQGVSFMLAMLLGMAMFEWLERRGQDGGRSC
jgi:uncharacterized membrane protein YedE/YeeE